jgi:uncharacterized protein
LDTVYSIKDGKIILGIKARPQAGKNGIAGILNNELVVRINAAPEKGKANREMISWFAKLLHIPKSEIEIVSGETSQHKKLCLPAGALEPLKKILKEQTLEGEKK